MPLDSNKFLKPVALVVKTEPDRVIELSSNHEERLKIFAQATEKTASVRSSPTSESPSTNISVDRTNEKTYFITDFDKGECWKSKTESQDRWTREKIKKSKSPYKLGQVTMLKVIDSVGNLVRKAVDYHTHRLIKQSATYDVDVTHKMYRMAKSTAVQMEDRKFSEKNQISVITFLQDFKLVYNVRGIHERATMWLFKQYLTRLARAAVKSRVILPSFVNVGHKGALQTYSEVV